MTCAELTELTVSGNDVTYHDCPQRLDGIQPGSRRDAVLYRASDPIEAIVVVQKVARSPSEPCKHHLKIMTFPSSSLLLTVFDKLFSPLRASSGPLHIPPRLVDRFTCPVQTLLASPIVTSTSISSQGGRE